MDWKARRTRCATCGMDAISPRLTPAVRPEAPAKIVELEIGGDGATRDLLGRVSPAGPDHVDIDRGTARLHALRCHGLSRRSHRTAERFNMAGICANVTAGVLIDGIGRFSSGHIVLFMPAER